MSFFTHSTPEVYLIVFKVYDTKGNLLSLVDTNAKSIKSKWRIIHSFLHADHCKDVREVSFRKHGRQFPSLVCSPDGAIRWSAPIVADLRGIV